jgi:hypothetical protein
VCSSQTITTRFSILKAESQATIVYL